MLGQGACALQIHLLPSRFKSYLKNFQAIDFKCRSMWSFIRFRGTDKMVSVVKGLMGQCSPRIFGLELPCSYYSYSYSYY